MTQQTTVSKFTFESFEQLREVVPGTKREIVQLEPGRLTGTMINAAIGDLSVNSVSFSRGVRSIGEYPKGSITLGLVMASEKHALHSGFASKPGDLIVTPAGSEQENRYFGKTSLVVTSMSLQTLENNYGCEAAVASLDHRRRSQFKGDGRTVPRIQSLLDRLRQDDGFVTEGAATFWKRAVVDAMLGHVLSSEASTSSDVLPSAVKIVRSVEELLNAERNRAIHISEICQTLNVRRRTLHRAFHEAVGVGPIAYLRFKRLCAVHTILTSGGLGGRTIEDLAFEFGFENPSRFSQYYKRQFGFSPTKTYVLSGDKA